MRGARRHGPSRELFLTCQRNLATRPANHASLRRHRSGTNVRTSRRTQRTTDAHADLRPHARGAAHRALACALALALAALAFACNKDKRNERPGAVPEVPDADGTPPPDADARDLDDDDGAPRTDVRTDTATDEPPTDAGSRDTDSATEDTRTTPRPDATPPPTFNPPEGRPDDWWCNRDARVDACENPLIEVAAPPTSPDDLLFYVNRWNAIPPDYPISETSRWNGCGATVDGPHDLICVPSASCRGSNCGLRQVAWDSPAPSPPTQTHDDLPIGYDGRVGYRAMFEAAQVEADVDLFVLSGFRPYDVQRTLHDNYISRERGNGYSEEDARIVASTYSAVPGHSEHQLGTTADLTFRTDSGSVFSGLSQAMGASRAFRWVFANGHRFGIVLTYEAHRIEETQYIYEPWHFRYVGVQAADAMRQCHLNTEEFLNVRYDAGPLPDFAGYPFILASRLALLAHSSSPPGTWVRPGERFTKGWRVRNAGTTNWWNTTLVQISGDEISIPDARVACVLAGQEAELAFPIDAPEEPGTYAGTFQLLDRDGEPMDDELTLSFIVSDTEIEGSPYLYVRVDDRSGRATGQDPGADIDAIIVTSTSGTHFATRAAAYEPGPGSPRRNDPTDATGAPSAFYAYPDISVCGVSSGFVSLGGSGFIVLGFDVPITEGDQVEVLEVGECEYATGSFAVGDAIALSVSVSPDGPWIPVGEGGAPVLRVTVPELPPLVAP